jgi:REP element-mobilizing transposase RayT
MPFTNILIHYIWSTKSREPLITKQLKPVLLQHVKSNSVEKGIFIDTMNCVEDHIHLLVSLGRDQTISEVAQLIKGESSNWLNKAVNSELIKSKFEWQDEYMAISVSQSIADKVRLYIQNQEAHHKKKTFQQEYDEFIKACNFKRD